MNFCPYDYRTNAWLYKNCPPENIGAAENFGVRLWIYTLPTWWFFALKLVTLYCSLVFMKVYFVDSLQIRDYMIIIFRLMLWIIAWPLRARIVMRPKWCWLLEVCSQSAPAGKTRETYLPPANIPALNILPLQYFPT